MSWVVIQRLNASLPIGRSHPEKVVAKCRVLLLCKGQKDRHGSAILESCSNGLLSATRRDRPNEDSDSDVVAEIILQKAATARAKC